MSRVPKYLNLYRLCTCTRGQVDLNSALTCRECSERYGEPPPMEN